MASSNPVVERAFVLDDTGFVAFMISGIFPLTLLALGTVGDVSANPGGHDTTSEFQRWVEFATAR
jgi:hypothetical protein